MGFAILWIIFFHFAMYGNLLRFPAVNLLFGKGYLGVDMFFFLSAYGLCHSLNRHTTKEYYVRRFHKLFPVYLVFLSLLFLAFPDSRGEHWLVTGLYQITGISMFIPLEIEWFIPALILLYIFFPLLYKAISAVYRKGFWAIALMIILLTVLCPLLSRYIFVLFSLRLVIIVIGILTYLALIEGNKKTLLGIYLICAFIGILYIGQERLNVSMTGSLLIPLLLYGTSQLSLPIEELRFLPLTGEHSLELYLAQCLAFNHFMASSTLTFIPTTLIAFSSVLIVSVVLFYVQKGYSILLRHA